MRDGRRYAPWWTVFDGDDCLPTEDAVHVKAVARRFVYSNGSLKLTARVLEFEGIPSPAGGAWTDWQVGRVLNELALYAKMGLIDDDLAAAVSRTKVRGRSRSKAGSKTGRSLRKSKKTKARPRAIKKPRRKVSRHGPHWIECKGVASASGYCKSCRCYPADMPCPFCSSNLVFLSASGGGKCLSCEKNLPEHK